MCEFHKIYGWSWFAISIYLGNPRVGGKVIMPNYTLFDTPCMWHCNKFVFVQAMLPRGVEFKEKLMYFLKD